MFNLERVHAYQRIAGTDEVRLGNVNPYVRIVVDGSPPVFLCEGKFWSEAGDVLTKDERPEGLIGALRKMNPVVLRECGWVWKEKAQPSPDQKAATPSTRIKIKRRN